jgi:hypothetical protein
MVGRMAGTMALLVFTANSAEIAMEQGTVSPSKPATLSLKLASGADLPTGVQFDLEYDPAALEITVENGPVSQKAAKSLRSATIQTGRLRVLIIGINRTTISDGVVALVHVAYKGSETGKTFPVHIIASSGTNANADKVVVTAKDGSVTVEK